MAEFFVFAYFVARSGYTDGIVAIGKYEKFAFVVRILTRVFDNEAASLSESGELPNIIRAEAEGGSNL